MDRQWYLSRNGQVFGPVTDAQLAESARAGRIFPTDQLNLVGQPHWWAASAVPGLLPPPAPVQNPFAPAAQQPLALDPEPVALQPAVEIKSLRVTCLACFREVTVEFEAGTPEAPCPKCRALLATGETATADAAGPEAAFGKLESAKAFKERMKKKADAATAGARNDGAVLGGILGAIIQG